MLSAKVKRENEVGKFSKKVERENRATIKSESERESEVINEERK